MFAERVFHLTYIARELRRRMGRTILTSLGLALGVGLVIGIIGVTQGLDDAQGKVLAPLKSVGTDILVTRVAGATATNASTSGTTTTTATQQDGQRRGGGGGFFIGGGGGRGGPDAVALNQADAEALAKENNNVVTDLSKLGKPGDQFTHDFFLSATLISFPEDALAQVAKIASVKSAVGGLVQLANHQTGTVPQIVANIDTGGETIDISPPTAAEQDQIRQCFEQNRPNGGTGGTGGTTGGTGTAQAAPGPDGDGGGGGGRGADCLPERFRKAQTQRRTIQQAIDPPQTNITSSSYTAGGVDVSHPTAGLVTNEQLTSGKWLSSNSANEVLANVAYANTKSLKVGDKIPINGTDFTVVGLVSPTLTGSTADLYFPLPKLQELATKQDRVTQLLVKADNSASVDKVAAAIKKMLPGAEVVTTKSLAGSVTGSLASAHDLANNVGFAVAAIVLAAAFAIAALQTLSSIGKRVREIGTLRAIGWSKGRVVRQLLGETMGIGLVGGLIGVAIGIGISAVVGITAPSLSATSTGVPGVASSGLSRLFNQQTATAVASHVKLSAPISASTLLLGVVFALVGGLIAGLIGSWRAARLAPSVALRDLG